MLGELASAIGIGIGLFSIYIAYLILVKWRIRGVDVTRELNTAVGALVLYLIVITMVIALMRKLPALARPPDVRLAVAEYSIDVSVLAEVKAIVDSILGKAMLLDPATAPILATVRLIADRVIVGVIKAAGAVLYYVIMSSALYRAMLALYPYAPLFITLSLVKPNNRASAVFLGLGIMILAATPLIGVLATGLFNIAYSGALSMIHPPCPGVSLAAVAYRGPWPAFILTNQGGFMTNGTHYLPTWQCQGAPQVQEVVWDWLVLNYTGYALPNNLPSFPPVASILVINAHLPFKAALITNSTGSYGAWAVIKIHGWVNSSATEVNDTALILRNASALIWAWVGGVRANCSLTANRTGLVRTTLIGAPSTPAPLAVSLGSYPPGYPRGYVQALINATAYNTTCLILFKPGLRWSGYTTLPQVGPLAWALAGPLNILVGVGQLVWLLEEATAIVPGLFIIATVFGLLAIPLISGGVATLGGIVIGLITPLGSLIARLFT
jgi:hypothetical protein